MFECITLKLEEQPYKDINVPWNIRQIRDRKYRNIIFIIICGANSKTLKLVNIIIYQLYFSLG